jgi:hypothetical protein
MMDLYCVLLWVVILSHFGFAVGQLIFWKRLSGRLTELTPDEAIKTKALWWSIG